MSEQINKTPTDPLRIKKEETDWKNEKALLEQKIELLEILVKETKTREENLRKMNENLSSALNDFAHDTKKFSNNGLKEIQMILEKNSQDFIQSKYKNNELVKVLDNEVKNLKEAIEKLQNSKQEDYETCENEKNILENKIHEMEIEKIKNENTIKSFHEAQKNYGISNFDTQIKMNNHKDAIELYKKQHNMEIDNLRFEHNQNFNELKTIYENEKNLIEDKLKSSQKLLKKYQKIDLNLRESSDFDKSLLEKENYELKRTIERINEEHMDEIAKYLQKIDYLEKKLSSFNNKENFESGSSKKCKTSKTSEIQLKEALMNKEKESNSSRKTDEEKHQSIPFLHETSILNHKEQMASNEENLNISKAENNCFDMFFKELTSRNDDTKRPKSMLQTSQPDLKSFKKLKSNKHHYNPTIEIEKNFEDNDSQEIITTSPKTLKEDLKKEGINFSALNSKKRPLSNKNLVFNKKFSEELDMSINENNRSADMVVINHNNREISIRKTPLQNRHNSQMKEKSSLNRVKSKTIATALLCEKCEETFQPQEFLEHLQYCQNKFDSSTVNSNRNQQNIGCSSNFFSNIFQNNTNDNINFNEKYYSTPNIPENNQEIPFYDNNNSFLRSNNGPIINNQNSEIFNVLDGLNKEKTEIIYQLKNVEQKLHKTQIDNQLISEEKENLQGNLRSLLMELQNIKLQMAYSAEEKKQAEILLKKEIKILIKKLVKTKGKLINQKNTSKLECTTNSSLVNLSGFINFYNQNKDNSTFGNKTVETQNNTDNSFLNQSIQQVFSNSLFTLANKSNNCNNGKYQSKSNLIKTPHHNENNTINTQKTPKNLKEIYCTPNKNEADYNINSSINNNNERKLQDKVKKTGNFQLFKGKFNESTAKQSKKINRYNN